MSIREAITNIREKNLEQMKENVNKALSLKAVGMLEEKKISIAKNYFGQSKDAPSKKNAD